MRRVLQHELSVDDLRRNDKFQQKCKFSPTRSLCFHMVFLLIRTDLIYTVTCSLYGQCPTNHNNKDTICKVKIDCVYGIETDCDKNSKPKKTIKIYLSFSTLLIDCKSFQKASYVYLKEAQSSKRRHHCQIFDEIIGDGKQDVPLEDISFVDKVSDNIHEAEINP